MICSTCHLGLNRWIKGEGHLRFGRPMLWRDPVDHQNNCYICITKVYGHSRKTGHSIAYANVDSVSKPIDHSESLPIPPLNNIPGDINLDDSMDVDHDSDEDDNNNKNPLYLPDTEEPHMLSQGDLDDLFRDLNLSKQMSELLAPRFQEWCLLKPGDFSKCA